MSAFNLLEVNIGVTKFLEVFQLSPFIETSIIEACLLPEKNLNSLSNEVYWVEFISEGANLLRIRHDRSRWAGIEKRTDNLLLFAHP